MRARSAAVLLLIYYGDSVINSVSDILAMTAGFWIASRVPVAWVVAATLLIEFGLGYAIRDNLTLNIIMLVYPLEAIRRWQSGG